VPAANKKSKNADTSAESIDVKAKLWLEKNSRFIIGAGRAEILRKIKETGSLAKAAKSMSMSYSHAWSEIRDISDAAGGQVVETSRGGASGGNSRLTELGEELLKTFDDELEKLDRHLAKQNG
jgi:molybdate transport system regulatory protein